MRKLMVLLVILVVAVSLPTMAQTHIGVLGGINLASLSFDPDLGQGVDTKSKLGAAFGGVVSFGLGEMLAVQLEPAYMQKGAKVEFDGEEVGSFKINYISVPVLFKYAFGQSTVKPYILAGPEIAMKMGDAKFSPKEGDDVTQEVKSIDFGVNFGAGVMFPMGSNSLFLEGQYNLGLGNINDEPVEADEEETKVKNKGIVIKAGIMFPLGG